MVSDLLCFSFFCLDSCIYFFENLLSSSFFAIIWLIFTVYVLCFSYLLLFTYIILCRQKGVYDISVRSMNIDDRPRSGPIHTFWKISNGHISASVIEFT